MVMILFSFPGYASVANQLADACSLKQGEFPVDRFPNQERYALVKSPPGGEHCLVLGSIAPPDERLISFLLLAHTLKKEMACKITALIPYLAYSRHDKDKPV